MPSRTTNVAEKPTVVMQIIDEPGSTVLVGKTMVLVAEPFVESSSANVKSPVDTTLITRLTPTSSCSAAEAVLVLEVVLVAADRR